MPLAEITTTVLLCLLAMAIILGTLVSVARDADWWMVTRGEVRGRFDRFRRGVKPPRG